MDKQVADLFHDVNRRADLQIEATQELTMLVAKLADRVEALSRKIDGKADKERVYGPLKKQS